MDDVAVLIPYGNGTPWRDRALEYVTTWYGRELKNPRILQGSGSQPWCKAKAVADALTRSTEQVLIIADADCVTPGLAQAVRAVQNGAPWAVPHLKVYRMGQQASRHIFDGVTPGSLTGKNMWLDQSPYKGYEGGGITVLRREVYQDCPLDPAFTGWGQEDEAWALALNGLYGPPWRGKAPMYHLWHEKPVRVSRYTGSQASAARLALYREARIHSAWDPLLQDGRRMVGSGLSQGRVAT